MGRKLPCYLPLKKDHDMMNLMLPSPSALYCGFPMADQLSPLSAFPFRHHELASPGSPISSSTPSPIIEHPGHHSFMPRNQMFGLDNTRKDNVTDEKEIQERKAFSPDCPRKRKADALPLPLIRVSLIYLE